MRLRLLCACMRYCVCVRMYAMWRALCAWGKTTKNISFFTFISCQKESMALEGTYYKLRRTLRKQNILRSHGATSKNKKKFSVVFFFWIFLFGPSPSSFSPLSLFLRGNIFYQKKKKERDFPLRFFFFSHLIEAYKNRWYFRSFLYSSLSVCSTTSIRLIQKYSTPMTAATRNVNKIYKQLISIWYIQLYNNAHFTAIFSLFIFWPKTALSLSLCVSLSVSIFNSLCGVCVCVCACE